jgi:Fungal specific transcription factor domain
MATVLMHDYALRMGNFTNAFMLCGLMSRMSQALQINLEYSTDVLCEGSSSGPSVTVRESRRRLMWSCWVADTLVGSGVKQLTILDEKDVKIQLPCNDRNFAQQLPCITEVLENGQVLPFVDAELTSTSPLQNMGIIAQFLRHIQTRKRVLG